MGGGVVGCGVFRVCGLGGRGSGCVLGGLWYFALLFKGEGDWHCFKGVAAFSIVV